MKLSLVKKIIRALMGILFAVGAFYLVTMISPLLLLQMGWTQKMVGALLVGCMLASFILGLLVAAPLMNFVVSVTKWLESKLQKMSTQDLLGAVLGLIIGLIVAVIIGYALSFLPIIGSYMPFFCCLIFGYLGISLGLKKRDEMFGLLTNLKKDSNKLKTKGKNRAAGYCNMPKVLDTSVIIDGRIADICKTGFVEGPLVIPNFVLEELRHIADSSDSLKRARGRRGLDMLNIIRKELDIEVEISNIDYDDISEVDDKLVRLAQELYGCVVTNDYNLNKVAALQEVVVLNINELANAIKPVVLPGETMVVTVVKEGKESNQGVAYLDDGTMIVVENGRRLMNETVQVSVTSVIQTNAGRMIFARALD